MVFFLCLSLLVILNLLLFNTFFCRALKCCLVQGFFGSLILMFKSSTDFLFWGSSKGETSFVGRLSQKFSLKLDNLSESRLNSLSSASSLSSSFVMLYFLWKKGSEERPNFTRADLFKFNFWSERRSLIFEDLSNLSSSSTDVPSIN